LAVEEVADLAARWEVSGREVEIAALENDIVPERYVRNMRRFTPADQLKLLAAHAVVVGLGGLGGGVVEILARIGVGSLTLIDGDTFEGSNLNRQFLSTPALLNTSKAEAAARRVASINASLRVEARAEFLDEHNAERLIGTADVTVDCLDNVGTRFVLERLARQRAIPLVSAAVAGDSGHVTTIFPEDPGLKLIYGDPRQLPQRGAEASLGTLPYCVTLLSALECAEVVKILLGHGGLLRNRLLVVDLTEPILEVLQLMPDPAAD
ncbi:MAG: HesA/MoeB/ThiF family protein, partial [Desulfobacterales bacterium]|nr:HesA/MoeB/ThiF family protein [Desulfobacterales bacterium]